MSSVSRNEVVAAAAIKYLRDLIVSYKGSPEKLGAYLLRKLDEKNLKADQLLAQIMDDII